MLLPRLGPFALALTGLVCAACPAEHASEAPQTPAAAKPGLTTASTNATGPASSNADASSPTQLGQAADPRDSGAGSSARSGDSASATEPAATPVPKPPYSIAVIGDSLSDPRSQGGKFLQTVLDGCPGTRVENLAVGGTMVNQMRRRFEEKVATQPPGTFTHLIVFGGVNDLYSDLTAHRTVEKITRDLSRIFEGARALKLTVIAFTVAPWGGFKRYYNAHRGESTRALNTWIREREGGLVDDVVDAYSLLSCGDSERLCPRYEGGFHDGIHFGIEGHRVLGKALLEGAFTGCP